MTVSTIVTDNNAVDTATWQARCQAIHNQLLALGLVATADTGQIDLTTAAKPSAANASAGAKMYRFSDALQATKPVFIRVEYGTASGTSGTFGLWMTVGYSTDGANNINSVNSGRLQVSPGSTGGQGGLTHYGSGANNRLAWFTTGAGGTAGMFVERAKDANGNETDGIIVMGISLQSYQVAWVPYNGTPASVQGTYQSFQGFAVLGSTATATDLAVAQIAIPHNGNWRYSTNHLFRYADLTSFVTFDMDVFGVTHTFLSLPGNPNTNSSFAWNAGLLMLWE